MQDVIKTPRNVEELSLKELKQIELEILLDFDRVCKDNNITYYIYAGTLLGAIRHKGFIPWDDDIDVVLDRTNYNKFLKARDQLKEKYKVYSIDVDKNYSTPLAKIIDLDTKLVQNVKDRVELGVYIDLFIWDYVPDNRFKRKLLFSFLDFNQKVWGFSIKHASKSSIIQSALRKICYFLRFDRIAARMMDFACRKQNRKTSKMGNLMFGGYGDKKEICSSSLIDEIIDIEFEGHKFPTFKNYEEFLIVNYGNYWELPPVEQRKSIHNFVAYKK